MKTVETINEVQETLARIRKLVVEAKADHDRLVSDNERYCALIDELQGKLFRANRDLKDCRNELCLRCGQYKTAHLGSCEGCRWRASE